MFSGSIIRNPASGQLFFSNPFTESSFRANMTLSTSTDNGTTWSPLGTIDPGPSAYSALVLLGNGSVGVLYEQNEVLHTGEYVYQNITFAVWSQQGR